MSLLVNGSQQNAQNKAYSCLKTNCRGKWKEFHAEKLISILLTGSIVLFCPSIVVTKWRVLISRVALFWLSKIFPAGLPKILLHLFEGDTPLFVSVGMLWLKVVYQVVIFVYEICQFYVCQKSLKMNNN